VAPPSIIDWDAFAAFQYQWGRQKGETSDPSVETFLDFVGGHGLLEMLAPADLTAAVKLHALDDDGERIGSWPLLRCFTAEIELSGTAYILDEGALFAVDGTYLDGLNSFIGGLPPLATSLPVTKTGEQEGPYNTRLASQLKDALLLDKKTVIRRQATAIEICDVAFKSRKLVHVKKGLSSSSLSHLFAQGVISAELLHMDEEFRAAVKQRLSGKLEGSAARARAGFAWLYESPFQTMRCEVAYVVMAGAKAKTRRKAPGLPFFSKVNLRQRCEELRRMGFAHSLTLVPHA
jgi:uncharacterized protein (TIGR04141 family)